MSAQPVAAAGQLSVKKDPLTVYEERVAKNRATNTKSELIKKQLVQRLTDLKAPTSTSPSASSPRAVFDVLPTAVNPGIFVNNVGHIRLPITKLDVDNIKAQTSRGLCGNRPATGPSSKIAGELKPGDFSLSNPMWQTQMEYFVDKVKVRLGIAASPDETRVTLHKLMCFEKDDITASTTELDGNADPLLVTLVICLPSPHTGGDIHVTHNDVLKVHKMAEATEFGFSFAAWFQDVKHEIKPIVAGHRVMLVYHITLKRFSQPLNPQPPPNRDLERLRDVLVRWHSSYKSGDITSPKELAYMFTHTYLPGVLKCDLLTPSDKIKVDLLREACENEGFVIYLARLEREVEGMLDIMEFIEYEDFEDIPEMLTDPTKFHTLDPIHQISYKLRTVCDLHGTEIAEELNFNDFNIARCAEWEKVAEREVFGGFRCEGELVVASQIYCKTVAVLVPRDRAMAFRFLGAKRGKVDVESWVQSLLDDLQKGKSDSGDESGELSSGFPCLLDELQTRKSQAKLVADGLRHYDEYNSDYSQGGESGDGFDSCYSVSSWEESDIDDRDWSAERYNAEKGDDPAQPAKQLERLCRMCIEHNKTTKRNGSEFHHHMDCVHYNPFKALSDEVLGKLAEASLVLKDTGLLKGVFSLVKKTMPMSVFKSIGKALHSMNQQSLLDATEFALSCLKKLNLKWRAISHVMNSYAVSSDSLTVPIEKLQSWQRERVEEMFNTHKQLRKEDVTCMLAVKGKYGDPWFVEKVLPALRNNTKQSALMAGILPRVIETCVNKAEDATVQPDMHELVSNAIKSLQLRSAADIKTRTALSHEKQDSKEFIVESTDLIQLTTECGEVRSQPYLKSLMDKITCNAKRASSQTFQEVLFPYMELLLEYLADLSEPELDRVPWDLYGGFFKSAMLCYTVKHVGVEPARSKDWVRTTPYPVSSCACRDCSELRVFLAMPTREDWLFTVGANRSSHLQAQAKWADVVVDVATEHKSKFRVQVVKGDKEFCTKWKEWKQKVDSTAERFREFEKRGPLKKLLWEKYNVIMLMKATKTPVVKKKKAEDEKENVGVDKKRTKTA